MHSLFRSLSRLLLLVMLATVLSPSFGWEAVQGMAAHDERVARNDAHERHMAAHEHGHHAHDAAVHAVAAMPDACAADCGGAAENCGDSRHHCCPGVMFGHLLGGTAEAFTPAIVAGASAVLIGRDARFSSRVPDGLERPPRAALA